jgi:hypothetical protein
LRHNATSSSPFIILVIFFRCFYRSWALASASKLSLVISSLPSPSRRHFVPFEILEV